MALQNIFCPEFVDGLLKFSCIWNFHNKTVCRFQSNSFCYSKIKMCNKNRRNVQFSNSDNKFSSYWIQFLVAKHINNYIIKNNQYFVFLFGLYSLILFKQTFFLIVTYFISGYHISLVNIQTNYCNNNILILDVKQLNKIIKLYYFIL